MSETFNGFNVPNHFTVSNPPPEISRRDYFAAMAMNGVLSQLRITGGKNPAEVLEVVAQFSFEMANAMEKNRGNITGAKS